MTNHNYQKLRCDIDALILDGLSQMPSVGILPLEIISIERSKLVGIEMNKTLFADFQLLVLERTDFNKENLIDYLLKSNEYQTMPPKHKLEFFDIYYKLAENGPKLKDWRARIISMAIGMIIQTALNKGLQLIPIQTDLIRLTKHIGLDTNNLKGYQLYDIYQIDPSYLV